MLGDNRPGHREEIDRARHPEAQDLGEGPRDAGAHRRRRRPLHRAQRGARHSLADIAAEAGVSQTGLLYHFGSKEALLNAVLDRHLAFTEEWLWGDGPDPGIKIVDIIARHMASWPSQHDDKVYSLLGMNTVVLGENVSPDTDLHPRLVEGYRTTIERVSATLRSAQERGEMRDDLDPQLKAMEIIAFCYGLEAAWLVNPTIPVADAATTWAAQQTAQMAAG